MNERDVKTNPPDQALLTRYLLGELAEDECRKIEHDCLADDNLFEQLEATEAELTDDYVRGVLRGRKRREFAKRVLNAPGAAGERKLAELITGCASPQRSFLAGLSFRRPLLLRFAAAATALTLAIAVGWFASKQSRPPVTITKSVPPASETASARPSPLPPQETAKQPASVKAPLLATFVLIPGGERGGEEPNEIRIPAGAQKVRFRIDLPSKEYDIYDASLNKVEGETLSVVHRVKAQASKNGATLFVVLPASAVPSGTSILTVRGVRKAGTAQRAGRYVIRVQGK